MRSKDGWSKCSPSNYLVGFIWWPGHLPSMPTHCNKLSCVASPGHLLDRVLPASLSKLLPIRNSTQHLIVQMLCDLLVKLSLFSYRTFTLTSFECHIDFPECSVLLRTLRGRCSESRSACRISGEPSATADIFITISIMIRGYSIEYRRYDACEC